MGRRELNRSGDAADDNTQRTEKFSGKRMKNIVVGRGRVVRVGPWQGAPGAASIATYVDQPVDANAVAEVVDRLRAMGYQRAVSAALAASEEEAFTTNGFTRLRELVLLKRGLDTTLPRVDSAQTRRIVLKRCPALKLPGRNRFEEVLSIDRDAFDGFWRFDDIRFREALNATPHRLLRLAGRQPPSGYALSGVSRDRAYLQRLAVRPSAAGHGVGTALLYDAMHWMRSRGASEVFVNTQCDNTRALALYERHGFVHEPEGLVIVSREL